jgi:hypothetical protein
MAEPYRFDPLIWGKNRFFTGQQWQKIKGMILAGRTQQEAHDAVFPPEPPAPPEELEELPPSAP